MGTTLPALDPINEVLDNDIFLMEHSNGLGFKLPGSVIKPVDAVTDGDMHAVTSNAVFDYLRGTWTPYVLLTVTDAIRDNQINLLYRKVTEHLVELNINPKNADLVVPNTLTQIATLPVGFRPAFYFEANIDGRIKVGSTLESRISIDINGAINIVNYGSEETINSPYNTYFFSI